MNTETLNDTLAEVLACVCSALESGVCLDGDSAQCGCPCRMFINVGPPVWDQEACCGEGQLTAHIERIYQFKNFPSQNGEPSVCSTELAAEVVVTLLRCWPAIIHEDGSAPNKDEIENASKALYRDLVLISKSVICCLGGKKSRPFVFNGARALGPDGGCAGVEARFTLPVY